MKDLSLNTVSQKDEKLQTARLDDTAIPYIILKLSKLLKYRLKKSSVP